MRLYLSSFRLGDYPEHLTELVGGERRIAVVANAIDMADREPRRAGVDDELAALRGIGLDPVELDLRDHSSATHVRQALSRCAAIWVRGGNTFVLREVMARSGADDAIRALLDDDALVYAGYSAGPVVLAPTLRGIELVDSLDDLTAVYGTEPIWAGLGVLPYCVVPHVDSPDHPESEDCNRLRDRYEREGIPHRAIRDGQAIVVSGAETEVV